MPYWRDGVQYICLVGCRLPPLDGYVAVCLVLTIDVYDITNCFTCLDSAALLVRNFATITLKLRWN